MNNKCPKCGEKLNIFYLKETCPHCGCNIMNYNMKKSLEEDAAKAEAEFEKLDRFKKKALSVFKGKKKKNTGSEEQ